MLAQYLSAGSVACSFIEGTASVPVPSLRCTLGRDDVSRVAALRGIAFATAPHHMGQASEARADSRGIWAGNSPRTNPPARTNRDR